MGLFDCDKKKNKSIKTKTTVERYLEHLDNNFPKEPEFYSNYSIIEGPSGVTSIVYKDTSEKSYTSALTYSLSLVKHPEWKFGRPELCISVESSSIVWGKVAVFQANKLRGVCPFRYEQTINFHESISDDSEMDAFFVFVPSSLNKNDYLDIDIGAEYNINIAGLYPMYSDELEVYKKIGLEAFWHHPNFDKYSVRRKRITKSKYLLQVTAHLKNAGFGAQHKD